MQHPRLPLTCLCTPAAAHPSPPDSRGCPALSAPGFVSACLPAAEAHNPAAGFSPVFSCCFQNGALAKRPLVSRGAAELMPVEKEKWWQRAMGGCRRSCRGKPRLQTEGRKDNGIGLPWRRVLRTFLGSTPCSFISIKGMFRS